MAHVTINGTSLATLEAGVGEIVLLVHGSNNDYRSWSKQIDVLSQAYRVVAYSRRYHYPNAQIPEGADYSMTEQLDDLRALIQSYSDQPVHLVGHSYGAFLCLLLAISDPQLIRSLALTEAPVVTLFIDLPPKPQQIIKLLLTRPRAAMALIKFATTGLNPATEAMKRDDPDKALEIFGKTVLGKEAFNKLSPERMEQARANNIKAEFLGSGFLPVDEAKVSSIQIPTLLITGEQSPPLFHHLTKRLDELLPNSEWVNITSASHIVHQNNAPAYNNTVLTFLNKHRQSSKS